MKIWLWRAWTTSSANWQRRKNEDRQHPLKMQNQPRAAPFSRTCRSCSKMNGIKPWISWNPHGPGEELEAGPLGSACPGFHSRRPSSL
ncbi:unnamed protein product [Gulo gulo]|uniref:Uncharacterized protein n=1 Tax=Gulo gulo TaxID=48420 RepID=A0A9X9LGF9_GULGU|nr:unnamed protein product [Gulo gulo]